MPMQKTIDIGTLISLVQRLLMKNTTVDIQQEIIPSLVILNEGILHMRNTSPTSIDEDHQFLYAYVLYKLLVTDDYVRQIHTLTHQLYVRLQKSPLTAENLYTPETGYTLALLAEDNLLPMNMPIHWKDWDDAIARKALHFPMEESLFSQKQLVLLQTIQYFTKRSAANKLHPYLAQVVEHSLPFFVSQYIGMSASTTFTPVLHLEQVRFGLNGGLAGMLLVLLKTYEIYPLPALQTVIQQGISYILSFRQDIDFSEGNYSAFPDTTNGKYAGSQFSRSLNWQSGDLVQALVFYRAATVFQDQELEKLANLIGLNTLLRTTEETTAITDVTLEKGSAGLSLLYHVLNLTTQNSIYQSGCQLWMDHTLQTLNNQKSIPQNTNLRKGLPGIGIALGSIAYGKENTWLDWLLK